ncbi:thioredoxin-like protein [Acephala macrosclerotiorum]|nr:thioredoxin-like protein [Acephala macrosclerotiorum]
MSVSIGSSAQFSKLLTTSTIVVADFYADWCGPCKAVAPTYESLATKHSKPNRITFTKINVDNQQAISQQYGVRAMPTFMIFKFGSVINTIRGADVRGLTTAIESTVKLAGAAAPAYSSVGRTLGGTPARGTTVSRPFNFKKLVDTIIAFFGLYFISLFSFDAYAAAENSPFNVNRPAQPRVTPGANPGEKRAAPQTGKKLGTIAGLGGD